MDLELQNRISALSGLAESRRIKLRIMRKKYRSRPIRYPTEQDTRENNINRVLLEIEDCEKAQEYYRSQIVM